MNVARLGRPLLTIAAVLAFVVLAGATYQGVATALERREYPRPGGMVDVGGHQLHIYCQGEGSPVVILEAPAMATSAAWGWVQPEVASTTRVCSYERPGLGWSEAGEGSFSASDVARQLQVLLEAAGERPPFVVAGQGLGAAYASVFTARSEGAVGALVLIDPPVAGRRDREFDAVERLAMMSPWLARAGVLRATGMLSSAAEGLPEEAAGAERAFMNRPDHLTHAARELARWDDVTALAATARIAPDVLVTRLDAAGTHPTAVLRDQAAAAAVTHAILEAVARVRQTIGKVQ